jgi:hypothetical protein
MIIKGPKPLPGLEIIAHELDRQIQINSELLCKIQMLEERIKTLVDSASGTDN